MLLFDDPNYKDFFLPLTGNNRKIHYDCAKLLIDETVAHQSELYEEDAKNIIAKYFSDNHVVVSSEDGLEFDDDASYISKACKEIGYLRSKGWITGRELAGNGVVLANISHMCMRLIGVLDNVFDDKDSGTLSNLLVSIHNILRDLTSPAPSPCKDKPYMFGVKPLYENVLRLRNEMAAFRVNIKQIRENVLSKKDLSEFNEFYLYDSGNNKLLEDYRYITKDGRFPQYVNEIAGNMRKFLLNEDIQKKILEEYESNVTILSEKTPKEMLDSMYSVIQDYFDYVYGEEVDIINKRIDEYIELMRTRLHLITSGEKNLATELDQLLVDIAEMEDDARECLLEHVFDGVLMYSDHKIFEERSISNRLTQQNVSHNAPKPVIDEDYTDEEIDKANRDLDKKYALKYSSKKTAQYLDNMSRGRDKFVVEDKDIKTRDDVICLMASIIHSGKNDYPYIVTINDDVVENDFVSISGLTIERRPA